MELSTPNKLKLISFKNTMGGIVERKQLLAEVHPTSL